MKSYIVMCSLLFDCDWSLDGVLQQHESGHLRARHVDVDVRFGRRGNDCLTIAPRLFYNSSVISASFCGMLSEFHDHVMEFHPSCTVLID